MSSEYVALLMEEVEPAQVLRWCDCKSWDSETMANGESRLIADFAGGSVVAYRTPCDMRDAYQQILEVTPVLELTFRLSRDDLDRAQQALVECIARFLARYTRSIVIYRGDFQRVLVRDQDEQWVSEGLYWLESNERHFDKYELRRSSPG